MVTKNQWFHLGTHHQGSDVCKYHVYILRGPVAARLRPLAPLDAQCGRNQSKKGICMDLARPCTHQIPDDQDWGNSGNCQFFPTTWCCWLPQKNSLFLSLQRLQIIHYFNPFTNLLNDSEFNFQACHGHHKSVFIFAAINNSCSWFTFKVTN